MNRRGFFRGVAAAVGSVALAPAAAALAVRTPKSALQIPMIPGAVTELDYQVAARVSEIKQLMNVEMLYGHGLISMQSAKQYLGLTDFIAK